MPEYQPIATAYLAAIRRPGCPACDDARMLLSRLEPGPSGFDKATFECQKCGYRQTMAVSQDAKALAVGGRQSGNLRTLF